MSQRPEGDLGLRHQVRHFSRSHINPDHLVLSGTPSFHWTIFFERIMLKVYLGGVGHLLAVTDAAKAGAASGANGPRGDIVRTAAALEVRAAASVLRALATLAEAARPAHAHAALRHAESAADERSVVVCLQSH